MMPQAQVSPPAVPPAPPQNPPTAAAQGPAAPSSSDPGTDVQKVVLTGMRIMYSPKTAKLLEEGLRSDIPMPEKLAAEIAGIMKLVDDRTPNGIPPQAIGPGAQMLLFDLSIFMKQSGVGDPSEADMKKAMQLLKPILLEIFTKHGKGVRPPPGKPEAGQEGQPMAEQPAGVPVPQSGPPQGLINAAQGA